jgi:hypothetical protein
VKIGCDTIIFKILYENLLFLTILLVRYRKGGISGKELDDQEFSSDFLRVYYKEIFGTQTDAIN